MRETNVRPHRGALLMLLALGALAGCASDLDPGLSTAAPIAWDDEVAPLRAAPAGCGDGCPESLSDWLSFGDVVVSGTIAQIAPRVSPAMSQLTGRGLVETCDGQLEPAIELFLENVDVLWGAHDASTATVVIDPLFVRRWTPTPAYLDGELGWYNPGGQSIGRDPMMGERVVAVARTGEDGQLLLASPWIAFSTPAGIQPLEGRCGSLEGELRGVAPEQIRSRLAGFEFQGMAVPPHLGTSLCFEAEPMGCLHDTDCRYPEEVCEAGQCVVNLQPF